MARYECGLDPATLSKAVAELNEPENNDERLAIIDSFRNRFKSQYPQIQLEKENDIFILQFLRASRFDLNKSQNLMKNYHTITNQDPVAINKANNPSALNTLFDSGIVCPLEGRAKDGSVVLVIRVGLEDVSLSDVASIIFLAMKNLVTEEINQIYGFTIIHDMSHLQPSITKKYTPRFAKSAVKIFSACTPVRINHMHITNQPKLFNLVYAIMSTFLDKKIIRISIHGKDFTKLHELIDASVLPGFIGGTGPELNPVLWKSKIMQEA